jgi:heme O synthase-like polyprenyltransferase
LIFGLFTLAIFILVEYKLAKSPIIPLHIFKNRSSIATLIVNISHGFCYIASAYFLPVYFQTALGATPILSGVWFLIMAGFMAS